MLATPTRSVAANRTGRHPRRPQRALVPPLCGGTSGPGAPRRALHASGPERWPARQQAAQSAFPTRATGGRRHKRGGGDATLLLSATPTHAFAGTQHGWLAYAGNMVRVDDIDFRYPDPVLETFAYNDANELTSQVVNGVTTTFTYDDWGRMVTKTQGGYTAAYRYRYGDKLKRIDTDFPGESALPVDFLYDGLGRRRLVALDMVNVSWHRYDLGWNVLGDYAAGGGSWGVGARVNSYQWHGMTPLAETPGANPGTGATRHHLHDHLGSTRALFDGGKARLARLDYAPHGQPTRALGAAANRSFTGKQYDAAIAMYHFPYRHYSPSHARWMTRDPLGMVDGPFSKNGVPRDPCGSAHGKDCVECCDKRAQEHFDECKKKFPWNWYYRGHCNAPMAQCKNYCHIACSGDPKMSGKDADQFIKDCMKGPDPSPTPQRCPN